MDNLKTLKDLNLGYESYEPEDENIRKQLRAEAINHWKDIEETLKGFKKIPVDEISNNTIQSFRGKQNWIKWFFNLKEEDLIDKNNEEILEVLPKGL